MEGTKRTTRTELRVVVVNAYRVQSLDVRWETGREVIAEGS